jgi:hypothetical protein
VQQIESGFAINAANVGAGLIGPGDLFNYSL